LVHVLQYRRAFVAPSSRALARRLFHAALAAAAPVDHVDHVGLGARFAVQGLRRALFAQPSPVQIMRTLDWNGRAMQNRAKFDHTSNEN